jgi:hypothetical protein
MEMVELSVLTMKLKLVTIYGQNKDWHHVITYNLGDLQLQFLDSMMSWYWNLGSMDVILVNLANCFVTS